MLDYARIAGKREFGKLVESRARDYYLKDTELPAGLRAFGRRFPLALPGRGRRGAPHSAARGIRAWLTAFLPRIDLEPTRVTDVTDGKLYHLAGLNLSRAWMLEGIVSKLPAGDARRKPLTALAARLQAGRARQHQERALRRRPLAGQFRRLPGEPQRDPSLITAHSGTPPGPISPLP